MLVYLYISNYVFHFLIVPLYVVQLLTLHMGTKCQENHFKSHIDKHFYISINVNSSINLWSTQEKRP